MRDGVRVSVVVAVHDLKGDVAATVRSALRSELQELEVIVVDNTVSARSAGLAATVQDARVLTVRLRPGGGAARPRNVGVARARAPYVALLEPGDLLKPDKLSAAVTALDRHPQAGFAFTDFEQVDAKTTVIHSSAMANFPGFRAFAAAAPCEDDWHLISQETLARALLGENFISTSSVVLRRKPLSEIGPFDESICCSEFEMWFRLAHCCAALYWGRAGHAHCDSGSAAVDAAVRTARDRVTVLQSEKSRWGDGAARRQLDRLIARDLAAVAYDERRRRRRLRATAIFAHAFVTSPEVRWLREMVRSVLRH